MTGARVETGLRVEIGVDSDAGRGLGVRRSLSFVEPFIGIDALGVGVARRTIGVFVAELGTGADGGGAAATGDGVGVTLARGVDGGVEEARRPAVSSANREVRVFLRGWRPNNPRRA